ncbi:hypothetical protein KXQ82_13500 [Mucilaginibacter sp. HMF5004]|uniref:hypothetical protein n=1 Tax=Mucilaginibacter rivuli TaxID=2857527 RepID=UPI001C5F5143|nr:hypothetical protein [Mucilaginibacter rivuli]MBW4890741.1 hypothetical protein [Mucilaginibacter rivuli]
MRVKTIFLLAVAIIVTVLIMQNNESAKFNILFFSDVYVSKLSVLLFVAVSCFIAGIVIAQPKKYKIDTSNYEADENEEDEQPKRNTSNTLSDEDRDYIN